MFCKNCGSEVNEGTQFCPSCGAQMAAPEAPQAPTYQAPVYQAAPAVPTVSASSVLTFGILGLALCETFILGLIFSIIGRKKAKQFQQENGALTGAAKVGSILAKVGLILSIVMLAILAIWITYAIVIAGIGAAVNYYY